MIFFRLLLHTIIKQKNIIVIGGGASGFFAAINVAKCLPEAKIIILEKSNKLLSKVKISGGGRCNVTHNCRDNYDLATNYPRGNKVLKQVFARFNVQSTIDWFKENGVELRVEEDGRMFPISNDSQTIIDCFLKLTTQLAIKIELNCEVFAVKKQNNLFKLKTSVSEFEADAIICSIGGHNKLGHYQFITNLGHTVEIPKPSLFTFNLLKHPINKNLQGIAAKRVAIKLADKKTEITGPLLITHWGFSGPAVLKLSAFEAEYFYDKNYGCVFFVNWVYPLKPNVITEKLNTIQINKRNALPYSNTEFDLPKRLWEFLCKEAEIDNTKPWQEISKKQINKLVEILYNSTFKMQGKTIFKEEFVTCGGVALNEIDFKTMESKLIPNLFFCGEVINVDGVTGGFNFQNAWSTAWISANSLTIVS